MGSLIHDHSCLYGLLFVATICNRVMCVKFFVGLGTLEITIFWCIQFFAVQNALHLDRAYKMLVPGGSWTPKFSHMPRTTGSWTTSRSWTCGTWWKCKSFQRGSCSCIWWHGMVFMVLTGVLIYVDVFWFWGEIFDWDLHRFATELLNWKVFGEILADFCLLRNHGNLDDWMSRKSISFISWGEPNPGQPAAAEPVEPDGNAQTSTGGAVAAFDCTLWYWWGPSFMIIHVYMGLHLWQRFATE